MKRAGQTHSSFMQIKKIHEAHRKMFKTGRSWRMQLSKVCYLSRSAPLRINREMWRVKVKESGTSALSERLLAWKRYKYNMNVFIRISILLFVNYVHASWRILDVALLWPSPVEEQAGICRSYMKVYPSRYILFSFRFTLTFPLRHRILFCRESFWWFVQLYLSPRWTNPSGNQLRLETQAWSILSLHDLTKKVVYVKVLDFCFARQRLLFIPGRSRMTDANTVCPLQENFWSIIGAFKL